MNKRNYQNAYLTTWSRIFLEKLTAMEFVLSQINTIHTDTTCLFKIQFFFLWRRVPQQKLRTHRSLKAYCATLWWRWLVSSVFPCNGAPVEWNWQRKSEVLGEIPVPLPLCPPQIPRGVTSGSNPGLRGERLATNRLRHGTARIHFNIFVTSTKVSQKFVTSLSGFSTTLVYLFLISFMLEICLAHRLNFIVLTIFSEH